MILTIDQSSKLHLQGCTQLIWLNSYYHLNSLDNIWSGMYNEKDVITGLQDYKYRHYCHPKTHIQIHLREKLSPVNTCTASY